MLFRMVPKPTVPESTLHFCFRAVLFRMVPKQENTLVYGELCFRAVLFRMVPKLAILGR